MNLVHLSNQFAIGDVHTMANCRDLVVYGCGDEIDASNELISDSPYNIGWEPQRSIWLNKYFSLKVLNMNWVVTRSWFIILKLSMV